MSRESTLPKLVSKGSMRGKRIKRISTPSTLIALPFRLLLENLRGLHGARENSTHFLCATNVVQELTWCNGRCYIALPQATRIYTDQNWVPTTLFLRRRNHERLSRRLVVTVPLSSAGGCKCVGPNNSFHHRRHDKDAQGVWLPERRW
jgi:hypothetical protein